MGGTGEGDVWEGRGGKVLRGVKIRLKVTCFKDIVKKKLRLLKVWSHLRTHLVPFSIGDFNATFN